MFVCSFSKWMTDWQWPWAEAVLRCQSGSRCVALVPTHNLIHKSCDRASRSLSTAMAFVWVCGQGAVSVGQAPRELRMSGQTSVVANDLPAPGTPEPLGSGSRVVLRRGGASHMDQQG